MEKQLEKEILGIITILNWFIRIIVIGGGLVIILFLIIMSLQ